MKSYYQHLKSTQEFGEKKNLTKKPVLRSSGIFPVIQNESYTTSIHFLGYWLLKRNISEVTLVITLRSSDGQVLLRKIEIIDYFLGKLTIITILSFIGSNIDF